MDHIADRLAFTVGGLAAIVAFVGGIILIGPSVAAQTAVQNELAAAAARRRRGSRRASNARIAGCGSPIGSTCRSSSSPG